MKRGLIFTLYKGSQKYEDDRKNYRDISLLPVIGKVFEKIVLNRIKTWAKASLLQIRLHVKNLCAAHLRHWKYQKQLIIIVRVILKRTCVY